MKKSCENCIHFEVCCYISHELPVCDSYQKSLVHCRDCKYAEVSEHAFGYGDLEPLCECWWMNEPHRWHEFCSFGERKVNNE